MATKVGMYLATYESVTVARGQRKENTDWVRNQSDCKIRYRALSKKKKKKMYIPHVYSWLFYYCKKNLFNRPAAHAARLYPLCFSHLMRNEQKDLAEKKVVGS